MTEDTAKNLIIALVSLRIAEEAVILELQLSNDLKVEERPDAEEIARRVEEARNGLSRELSKQIEETMKLLDIENVA